MPQNVTLLGDSVFTEEIQSQVIRMGLIQYDWCPYGKRLGHTQRNNHVKTQGEDGRLRAMERGLELVLA